MSQENDAEVATLSTNPTMKNTKPASYLVNYQNRLDKADIKSKQVYETEDYRSDNLIVTAFKKVSAANAKKGKTTSSYVSSFPFSGHSRIINGAEVMPPIEDKLQNQEPLLKDVDQAAM